MKTSRFSEEQVAYALRQAESGTAVSDVCRQLGVSEATCYVWKKKFAHLGVGETAAWLQTTFAVSCVRACRLAGFSRAAWYRRSRAKDQGPLRLRIREIAEARPRFGYHRVYVLLRREGWRVNLKRVRRLYRLEGLQVRLRVRKRRHRSLHRGPVPTATGLRQRWSMDFVHDQLANGRAFRVLTVVDQWNRQSPLLEVVQRVTGADVAAALDRRPAVDGLPRSITVDHGTQFTSQALDALAFARGDTPDFARPGKPTDNGHIESFNARLRDECLNVHQFQSLDHVKALIKAWRIDYNQHRPHGSLGHLTPAEFAAHRQVTSTAAAACFCFRAVCFWVLDQNQVFSSYELYRNGT